MANVDRYIQKKRRSHEEGNRPDFECKIIRDGANKFRIVGDITFVYEHWFKSADGVSVHAVSTKRYNPEGELTGDYILDDVYSDARALLADEDGLSEGKYTEAEIERAEIITGDRKANGDQFPCAWKGREYAYMNIIDRDDNWCRDNKKTKILCKSKSQGGVSSGKNGIFDEIVEMFEEYGDYEKYDIKLKKSGKKLDTKYSCFKDNEDELTDEEKEYELWDLEEITIATPEATVKKWLNEGIKKDADKNKDGKADKPKRKSVFAKGAGLKKKDEKTEAETETETETKIEAKKEEKVEKKADKKAANGSKKLKVKIKEEKKTEPEPEVEEEKMAQCPECEAMIPVTSEKCPSCGVVFEGFEDDDKSDV